ncbi:hypothetical protein EK21DRAFT_54940 [Setomelanomma holmii]|uniref:Methyltransferase type 11 domain-containing protein n=1 Tax=Setomelanomma holmii TaxID=210430 RepID=A0A9P4HLD4_9PLEO|nr:hypothetical protein EK21DRAFT_54940 [Setomelanomma holmii]
MFPTFDVPPQHAETVGARKARRAKEEETARRSSSATSRSSGSTHSAKANSAKSRTGDKSGGFGWFGKSSKKGVQEISTLPSIKKPSLIEEHESVFSNISQYDSAISEESYDDHHFGSNVQLEPVERGSRTGSRQGDHVAKSAQSPFARALAKMESAGARIIATRLSEEWEGLDDDESYQEVIFEKRLWALTAYQRLTQNKQLQSPAHELFSGSRPADQRRILHLHGSLAPLNHHLLYVPSLSSPTPFPDNYFDAIVSRSVATVLRNDEWARSFFDCMRVLKPGGQIEILSIDAHLSCEGPRLSAWVDEHLSCRLEAHGLSRQASDTVLDTMEIVGRMMSFLGRHFYQDLHGKFLRGDAGEEWFWARKDIRDECERYKTKMVLTIACALKPMVTPGESYLDI